MLRPLLVGRVADIVPTSRPIDPTISTTMVLSSAGLGAHIKDHRSGPLQSGIRPWGVRAMCGRAGGRRFGRVANLASQVLSPRVRTGCAAAMDSPLQTVAFSSMLDYQQAKNKRMSTRPTDPPPDSLSRGGLPSTRAEWWSRKGGRPAGHPSSSGSSEGHRGTGVGAPVPAAVRPPRASWSWGAEAAPIGLACHRSHPRARRHLPLTC
jgi:hypothetical protein